MLRRLAPLLVLLAACARTPSEETLASSVEGTSWRLVEFQSSSDAIGVVWPEDPSAFTLSFGRDGRVALRLDCYRAGGAWEATPTASEGGTLSLGPVAVTDAACSEPALADQIVRQAEYVRSYILRDGRLYLSLMADGGVYAWEPAVGTAAGGFDHPAVGAIMVFDPSHPEAPGWRPGCSAPVSARPADERAPGRKEAPRRRSRSACRARQGDFNIASTDSHRRFIGEVIRAAQRR